MRERMLLHGVSVRRGHRNTYFDDGLLSRGNKTGPTHLGAGPVESPLVVEVAQLATSADAATTSAAAEIRCRPAASAG